MVKPVLVDTSVWIAYLRKDELSFATVNKLVDSKRVYLMWLVLAELYQGCKSNKELGIVRDLAGIFPMLKEDARMWEEAGILAFKLRKQGQTIGLADCYLATVAKKAGALIYSYDKHFEALASAYGVELFSG